MRIGTISPHSILHITLVVATILALPHLTLAQGKGKGGGGGSGPALAFLERGTSTSERGYTILEVVAPERVTADETVSLSVSDSSLASVPASVVIPAGTSTASFAVSGVADSLNGGEDTVIVTAVSTNFSAGTTEVVVQDDSNFPNIEYLPIVLAPPYPATLMQLNDLNDLGMACGFYLNLNDERSAWFFDGTKMIDLNDLSVTGMPSSDWSFLSAVSVNNNGLIVGYYAPFKDLTLRKGFVLDLSTNIVHGIPDEALDFSYARKVNDNGDVLFVGDTPVNETMVRAIYLFNPGLRLGAPYSTETVRLGGLSQSGVLRNTPIGMPAEVVGGLGGGLVLRYLQGLGPLEIKVADDVQFVQVNSLGDIVADVTLNEEVTVRKNRTELVPRDYVYREIGDADPQYLSVPVPFTTYGLTNSGVSVHGSPDGMIQICQKSGSFVDLYSITNNLLPVEWSGGVVEVSEQGEQSFPTIAFQSRGRSSIVILTPSTRPAP